MAVFADSQKTGLVGNSVAVSPTEFLYKSQNPESYYIIEHNLDSEFLLCSVMVEDSDMIYRNLPVVIDAVDNNKISINLNTASNIKVFLKRAKSSLDDIPQEIPLAPPTPTVTGPLNIEIPVNQYSVGLVETVDWELDDELEVRENGILWSVNETSGNSPPKGYLSTSIYFSEPGVYVYDYRLRRGDLYSDYSEPITYTAT